MVNKGDREVRLVKKTCAQGSEVDTLSAVEAFEREVANTRRRLNDFKVGHWRMMQAFQKMVDACKTPEEIERAYEMFKLALIN